MLENIRNNSQSIWVKVAFGIIILVFIFWGIGSYNTSSSIVAKVNDYEITEQEFIRTYNQQAERLSAFLPDINEEQLRQMQFPQLVLETLVLQKLLESEADRTGIDITAHELFEVIAEFPFAQDGQGNFSADNYLATLQQAGQSPRAFEDSLKNEMREGKFRTLLGNFAYVSEEQARLLFDYQYEERAFDAFYFDEADFIDTVTPTEEELLAVYDLRQAEFTQPASIQLEFIEVSPEKIAKPEEISNEQIQAEYNNNPAVYDIPETVTASHILITLQETATSQDEEKALSTIQEIQQKLAAGEDFAQLAKEYSQDTASGIDGGYLGSFPRGVMVAEFEDAAFSTAVGEVSDPVRSAFGYHLVYVQDKQAARAPAIEELEKEISHKLAIEKANSEIQSLLDTLLIQLHGSENSENVLNEIAQNAGFEVISTEFLPLDTIAMNYGISDSDMQMLVALESGSFAPTALAAQNGYLITKVVENQPDRVMPFEAVEAIVTALAKRELANEVALESANTALTSIDSISRAPETYVMGRDGIFDLGDSVQLSEALFSSAIDNAWIDQAFAIGDGYIIVKPTAIIPASDSAWNTLKDAHMAELLMARQNLLYALYIGELRDNAEIEIVNPLYFE